jgi:hypothetical protein
MLLAMAIGETEQLLVCDRITHDINCLHVLTWQNQSGFIATGRLQRTIRKTVAHTQHGNR